MDLVTIEPSVKNRNVVFWEAKLVTDGRLRCSTEVVEDKKPKVLEQLARYRLFLNDPKHGPQHVAWVAKAYRHTAKLMTQLRLMANKLGNAYPLGPTFAKLLVMPRLVLIANPASSSLTRKTQIRLHGHATPENSKRKQVSR